MIARNHAISLVVVTFGALAIAACGGAPQPAADDVASVSEPLATGTVGGGENLYSCGELGCICYGDNDCNNMFTDGACGSWNAKCYIRGGTMYCTCSPTQTITGAGGTTSPKAPVGTLSKL